MKKSSPNMNILLLVLLTTVVAVKCEVEIFKEIVINPAVKYVDINGTIELNDSTESHNIFLRKASSCQLPKSSDTSRIVCKDYPNRIECSQTCIFGYTLKEGIQVEMTCNKEENVWTPVASFESCKPFIDCMVKIKEGGKKVCYTNYLTRAPWCKISCEPYEDKPEVETKKYECNIEGKWEPKLPHCAEAGSGMKLVPAPKGDKKIFTGEEEDQE